MSNSPYNPYETAQAQFDRWPSARLDEAPGAAQEPMREYHFLIPVQMDDGSYKAFKGYRIQHNDAR